MGRRTEQSAPLHRGKWEAQYDTLCQMPVTLSLIVPVSVRPAKTDAVQAACGLAGGRGVEGEGGGAYLPVDSVVVTLHASNSGMPL